MSAITLRAPQMLPSCAGRHLRVLSYNILADQYAGSTFAQQVGVGIAQAGLELMSLV